MYRDLLKVDARANILSSNTFLGKEVYPVFREIFLFNSVVVVVNINVCIIYLRYVKGKFANAGRKKKAHF